MSTSLVPMSGGAPAVGTAACVLPSSRLRRPVGGALNPARSGAPGTWVSASCPCSGRPSPAAQSGCSAGSAAEAAREGCNRPSCTA
eukprot:13127115-Alexandrium_andersonii.AAC.1